MDNILYDGGLTFSMGVKDLNKSIIWYSEVLGFKLVYKLDDMGWAEMETPVNKVNIGLSEVEKVEPNGSGATPVLGVKNIEEAKRKLSEYNVKFDGEIHQVKDMVKLLTFYDLDGNTFMLYQDLKATN